MNLPKVLIVGQTFNDKTGGGITQTNLFSGWDKDRLAVACTAHLMIDSNPTVCDNYYQLGEKEQKWMFPFNLLHRKFASGPINFTEVASPKKDSVKTKNFRSKLVDDFFYPLLKFSGLIHVVSKIKLSSDFSTWVKDFRPDVIYAQGQDRERILFSLRLQEYLQIPLIYHFMDDWPSTVSERGIMKRFWFIKINNDLKKLLNKASLLMTISDLMAHEFKKRYNKEFVTFHNPVDLDFWGKYQKNNYKLSDSPSILYAGRIGLGVESSLESVAKSIELINKEINASIKFTLQTREIPEWTSKYSCVQHTELVPYWNLPEKFSQADVLLISYDFSRESIKYIQYSMPTKAPEYMISGTPILIFAPEMTALVKYAQKDEWAKTVTENNISSLCNAIKEIILNECVRERISANAKLVASERHNITIVAKNFQKLVCSIV